MWVVKTKNYRGSGGLSMILHKLAEEGFVCSLLQAGVQPTLDPSAETFMSVQCASPGGEEGN